MPVQYSVLQNTIDTVLLPTHLASSELLGRGAVSEAAGLVRAVALLLGGLGRGVGGLEVAGIVKGGQTREAVAGGGLQTQLRGK